MKRQAFLLVILLLVTTQVWASPDTPGEATSLQVEPYQNGFGTSASFTAAMGAMGYSIREAINTPSGSIPDFGINDYATYLGNGYGHIWIQTHGNTGGHGIETFDNATSRNNRWDWWMIHGWSTTHIYRGDCADGYHIGMRAAGISNYFTSNSTSILNNSCYSNSYSGSWTSSRVYIGSAGDGCSVEDNFYAAVGGGATFASSIYGTMVLSGTGETVLAPMVSDFSNNFGDLIPEGGLEVTWTFTGACAGNFTTSGPAYLCAGSWDSDNVYRATVCPLPGQTGQVWLASNFTSGNGVPLVHPTNNWGFFVGTNSAADVSFGVRNTTAIWRVGSEYNTSGYLVEAATSFSRDDEDWKQTGPEHASGFLEYEMDVSEAIADGKQWFRLIENETTGNRLIHGYAQPTNPGARPQMPAQAPTVEGFTDAITAHRAAIDDDDPPGDLPVDVGTGESLKIYTVAAFEDAIEANYASYWRLYGYDVSIEVIPGYPQTATAEDAQVNDLMARIAANTAAGVKYHEIWGRDNPYHYMHGERWSSYWTGPWLAIHGQMENRYLSTADDIVIPAPTVRDDLPRGQNVSYWWPYFRSDKMYEVPGSVVTRVPVSHLWQIAAYSFIIQQTNDFWSNPSYGMGMGLFVGDLDHMGDGDGQLAWAAADMTRAMLAERGHYLTIVRESVIPNPELRNRHMADQWNGYLGGRTNLNFMYASQSGPHYPGNMYSKRELGDDVWRMDLVFPYINHHPMFIAPTCATSAAWAIDDSWYYHTAVVIDMLFHEAGASGYYGPSCGSLTSSNQEIGYIVADYVTADFSRPTFESIALAEQEIAALYSDNPRINLQLLTMSKIGSALTRVGQVQVVTAVGDQIPQLTHLAQNTPNPFNPKTSIQFEIKDAGRVTLKVFNIRGSLVKTLIDDVLPAGPHHSVWDGTDGGGRQVASGTYFYRIEVGSRSVSRKMSLLK